MDDTQHLLSTEANAKRLAESIAQLNKLPYAFTRAALAAKDDDVVPYVRRTPRK